MKDYLTFFFFFWQKNIQFVDKSYYFPPTSFLELTDTYSCDEKLEEDDGQADFFFFLKTLKKDCPVA